MTAIFAAACSSIFSYRKNISDAFETVNENRTFSSASVVSIGSDFLFGICLFRSWTSAELLLVLVVVSESPAKQPHPIKPLSASSIAVIIVYNQLSQTE
eukprot:UN25348